MLFKNKYGQFKTAKVGFNFPLLLFGMFYTIYKKDLKWTGIFLLTALGAYIFAPLAILSFVYPFFYNKLYIKELLKQGYYPVENCHEKLIVAYNVVSLDEMKMYQTSAIDAGIIE